MRTQRDSEWDGIAYFCNRYPIRRKRWFRRQVENLILWYEHILLIWTYRK